MEKCGRLEKIEDIENLVLALLVRVPDLLKATVNELCPALSHAPGLELNNRPTNWLVSLS